MTIICTVEELSSCPYKIHKLAECMRPLHWCSQTFITGKCLWNGRALINPFLCMQSWNQPFFSFFFVAIRWGGGGGISGRFGAKFNCAARSGRVGSDNLGYGPGSGFSFEPVQTSNKSNNIICFFSFTEINELFSLCVLCLNSLQCSDRAVSTDIIS